MKTSIYHFVIYYIDSEMMNENFNEKNTKFVHLGFNLDVHNFNVRLTGY